MRKLLICVLCICVALVCYAENNYKVSSSSRLNVRRAPSTTGAILGTLNSGQEITVLSITKGWAKIEFKNTTGYVSAKYITELSKKIVEAPEVEEVEEVIEEMPVVDETVVVQPVRQFDTKVVTLLTIGSFMPEAMNLYLTVQGGFGWSNFLWSDGSVNGTMSYSADVLAQLYFEDKVSFIPKNWYSELGIGYDKKGAADFDMSYIHLRLYPLGYRIPLNPFNIVIKGGVSLAFSLSELKTNYGNSWNGNFQCGVGGGLQIEWKQFAIGCNVEYDFTEVASDCNQTLNNIAILGTISYKLGIFGHK